MVHQGITERGLLSFIASVPLFTNLLLLFGLSLFFSAKTQNPSRE